MSRYKPIITPVEYGRSVLSEDQIFRNGDGSIFRPIVFRLFLVRAEDRLLLVDAGCETMPGFEMTDFIGPVKALEQLGISTEDITDVIITHAHHDHIESVRRFGKARVYIQKDEYELGRAYFDGNQVVTLFDNELQLLLCHDD